MWKKLMDKVKKSRKDGSYEKTLISVSVILSCYDQSTISGSETKHYALPPTNI